MPTDLARKAEALRAVAGALREWFPIACDPDPNVQGSPAGREAARNALALACENLPLIEDCRHTYGLHGWFDDAIATLRHCRAVVGRQDLGDFWAQGQRMTSHHHPKGPFLWDELERWAKEIEKAAALHTTDGDDKAELAKQSGIGGGVELKPGKGFHAKKGAELGGHVAVSTKEFDAFLCHASEDKDAVVRPFADLMIEHGLRPWLDEREINWGHNLAKKIQEGLAGSRFVVVFLSSAFLSKKGWTDKELNTALSMHDGENPLVLPVVLGITHEELEARYPLVSAKKYHKIPDYDPAKRVPTGELKKLVEKLNNMIGVSARGAEGGRP